MARSLNMLTDRKVRTEKQPGRYSDGQNLYLEIKQTGSRAWLFMWKSGGKRTAMGLGPYPDVGLAEARDKAAACRKAVAAGRDPREERRRDASSPTFAQVVERYLDDTRMAQWRSSVHRHQWVTTLGPDYCVAIFHRKIAEIGVADVLAVLQPIWATKPVTASRLRGRIEKIIAYAEAHNWRPESKNPAQWRSGLDAILPAPQKLRTVKHHAALGYDAVPAFMRRLAALPGMSSRALRFIVLTASRAGEATGARWSEIDLDAAVWTVPASRMKAGREHRVPLSTEAADILRELHEHRRDDYVFFGQRRGRPVTRVSLSRLLLRMQVTTGITIHGFRSAFRDWCGDMTGFPRELAEAALAHRVGDATERAYRRSSALERRRELMQAWASYCVPQHAAVIGNVVPLIASSAR